MIAGDFNSDAKTNPAALACLSELGRYDLHCQVNEPKFYQNSTQSVLDVVFLSDALCSESVPPVCTAERRDYSAHHWLVTVTTTIPGSRTSLTHHTSRRALDTDTLLEGVASSNWNQLVNRADSCETRWDSFSRVVSRTRDNHTPIRQL